MRRALRKRRTILAFAAFIAGIIVFFTADSAARPIIRTMATANVEVAAAQKISEAIEAEMTSDTHDLAGMISFEKDSEGRINAVKTNIEASNRLKASLSLSVLDKISSITENEVSVPLGSLSGLTFLSGRGPSIPVKTVPVGSVKTALQSVFSNGGINQTLHRIILGITATVNIILPRETVATDIDVSVVIAETVIIGTVPDYFADINIPLGK